MSRYTKYLLTILLSLFAIRYYTIPWIMIYAEPAVVAAGVMIALL